VVGPGRVEVERAVRASLVLASYCTVGKYLSEHRARPAPSASPCHTEPMKVRTKSESPWQPIHAAARSTCRGLDAITIAAELPQPLPRTT
jgi:hypothetical protein